MKVIFAGSSTFAVPALEMLVASKNEICAVLAKPDLPTGRGLKISDSLIKQLAQSLKLPVYQPSTLKDQTIQQQLKALNPDILVNVAYGVLLPPEVLAIPKLGAINIHPSLLPKWRGAAPIQRAILAGESTTGVSIMQLDQGLDTGAIYLQQPIVIDKQDTTLTLSKKTSVIGAELLLKVLNQLKQGTASLSPQNESKATYAAKLTKAEGKINWNQPALVITRGIRAFNPWPVAYSELTGLTIRFFEAEVVNGNLLPTNFPGTIAKVDRTGIEIATTLAAVKLTKAQLPGGKTLKISELINSKNHPFKIGALFI